MTHRAWMFLVTIGALFGFVKAQSVKAEPMKSSNKKTLICSRPSCKKEACFQLHSQGARYDEYCHSCKDCLTELLYDGDTVWILQ